MPTHDYTMLGEAEALRRTCPTTNCYSRNPTYSTLHLNSPLCSKSHSTDLYNTECAALACRKNQTMSLTAEQKETSWDTLWQCMATAHICCTCWWSCWSSSKCNTKCDNCYSGVIHITQWSDTYHIRVRVQMAAIPRVQLSWTWHHEVWLKYTILIENLLPPTWG